ncbi:CBS domain-containing protein [Mucilaginibacter sp. RB4R14]|uniref:CBS domain-containing protein n=1 Tax=Mucilaginibacter aurantiaciroseus TaxID=2949308 RepID=UPI0020913669|nr:CBS domain-containing protein [Mucilaginibacter aurantiaciroseus]MCO5936595.1 CBS domain-containing protein [Mucilaginibacter aurantiaciroseus]
MSIVKEEFAELVNEIKENDKEFEITPRTLLDAFWCEKRTSGNQARVDQYLFENQLETEPDYRNGWFDGDIILRHRKRAKAKNESDPIQRLKLLPAANKELVTVQKESTLKEAITLMMLNNYSQLPVMSSTRNVYGVVNWDTIGFALANGCKSDDIKDYTSKYYAILDYDTPLLEAISVIIEKEFALVQKNDKTISGIVTLADISTQFITVTEPFLLLEQIEKHLRQILDSKFLVDDLREFCKIGDIERDIEFIDDLAFGDYLQIFSNPDYWEKLNLSFERSHFIKMLDKVRIIRNDIMHFDPEGITKEQREDLTKMAKFLMLTRKF